MGSVSGDVTGTPPLGVSLHLSELVAAYHHQQEAKCVMSDFLREAVDWEEGNVHESVRIDKAPLPSLLVTFSSLLKPIRKDQTALKVVGCDRCYLPSPEVSGLLN